MTKGAKLVTKGGKQIPETEARVSLKAKGTDLVAAPLLLACRTAGSLGFPELLVHCRPKARLTARPSTDHSALH